MKFMTDGSKSTSKIHAVNGAFGIDEILVCTGELITYPLLWNLRKYSIDEFIKDSWSCQKCIAKIKNLDRC